MKCDFCGGELHNEMYCPHCGAINTYYDQYADKKSGSKYVTTQSRSSKPSKPKEIYSTNVPNNYTSKVIGYGPSDSFKALSKYIQEKHIDVVAAEVCVGKSSLPGITYGYKDGDMCYVFKNEMNGDRKTVYTGTDEKKAAGILYSLIEQNKNRAFSSPAQRVRDRKKASPIAKVLKAFIIIYVLIQFVPTLLIGVAALVAQNQTAETGRYCYYFDNDETYYYDGRVWRDENFNIESDPPALMVIFPSFFYKGQDVSDWPVTIDPYEKEDRYYEDYDNYDEDNHYDGYDYNGYEDYEDSDYDEYNYENEDDEDLPFTIYEYDINGNPL